MKLIIKLEHWDWPFFKVEPSGFEHLEVTLREPSQKVEIKAVIPLKDALVLGKELITLSETLMKEEK